MLSVKLGDYTLPARRVSENLDVNSKELKVAIEVYESDIFKANLTLNDFYLLACDPNVTTISVTDGNGLNMTYERKSLSRVAKRIEGADEYPNGYFIVLSFDIALG